MSETHRLGEYSAEDIQDFKEKSALIAISQGYVPCKLGNSIYALDADDKFVHIVSSDKPKSLWIDAYQSLALIEISGEISRSQIEIRDPEELSNILNITKMAVLREILKRKKMAAFLRETGDEVVLMGIDSESTEEEIARSPKPAEKSGKRVIWVKALDMLLASNPNYYDDDID